MAALAGAALSRKSFAQAEPVKWSSGTEKPRAVAPPGAVDCHVHTYDHRYPAMAGATLLPEDASVEDYRALQRRIGTSRGVIIQPSTYGTDNSLQLASRQALGPESFRVVAVLPEDVSDDELKRLDGQGVRGVRFTLTLPGVLTIDSIKLFAPRLAALGWNCQVVMRPKQIEDSADMLAGLPGQLVFDHLGQVPQPGGLESASYKVIRRLLDGGNTWVKLSGAYTSSKEGPPNYSDVGAVAAAYVKAAPERMVWGSDWPHPTRPNDGKPDDARLFDLLFEWAGNEAAFKRILVDNPEHSTDSRRSRYDLLRAAPPGRDHRLHPPARLVSEPAPHILG